MCFEISTLEGNNKIDPCNLFKVLEDGIYNTRFKNIQKQKNETSQL